MHRQYRALPRKATWLAAIFLAATLPLVFAQYPGHIDTQKKTGPSLRAIAVLEWTGTEGKPSASRLIPIAVFDGENYQPGGLYLARPQPLALDSGTEYILQSAGVPQGLFDVNGSQEVQGSWLGYGVWRKIAPPPMRKVQQGKNMPQVVKDADQGRPHFSNGSAGTGSSSPAAKPGNANSGSSGQNPPADSDRPVLVRRTSSTDSSGNGSSGSGPTQNGGSSPSGTSSGSAANSPPPVDPDRPVLRRRSASSPSSPENSPSDFPGGPETAILAPDPNRPHLTYGSSNPVDSETFEEPKLAGNPIGLQRMVAVSDATDREPHPLAYSWANPEDAAKMKTQMEALAQKALAPAAKAPEKAPAGRSRRHTVASRHSRKAAAAALPELSNERFAAYQLTYDSGATVVYSAQSTGATGKTRYVILVAQPDFYGVPHVIFTSVTEDGMLDLTPRMQLVDAVDGRGNNRGDLLFELRSSHSRQFAIYRVIQGQFQQIFVTGSLALSSGPASSSNS